jgi:delta-aminolevulinic acid dehydratase/porphobilinogen synthase
MAEEARELQELGIAGVLLFGLPEEKDEIGSSAWDPDGPVQLAVQAIKLAAPELTVVTDVCMCEYTTHGHCGVIGPSGDVDNDETLDLLARTAISHAAAGADAVAPSDMMDGRTPRSSLTARSSQVRSTARSATPPIRRRSPTATSRRTAAATRWIRPTRARPCAKRCSMSTKARTS